MSRAPRGLSGGLPLVSVLGLCACSSLQVVDRALPEGYAWPPGQPRVRLERIIELERRAGKLRGVLGGEAAEPLLVQPYGLAWDGDDLLVADPGARAVMRVGAGGRVSLSPEGHVGAPVGVAVCPYGIVTTDPESGRVALLAADLRRSRWLAEGLERPTGVVCSSEALYVVETAAHRVAVLDADARREPLGRRGAGPGEFNFPTAVALSDGVLVVGDTLNFRIQRLDLPSGDALGSFGALGDAPGEMPRLKGVAIDAAGRLWVSDAHMDRVSLFTPEGELLMSLGGPGSAPGRFSFPTGIAAHPDGRVAVSDSFNRRIQVFRLIEGSEEG